MENRLTAFHLSTLAKEPFNKNGLSQLLKETSLGATAPENLLLVQLM
jgi:hypothetical protein